MITLEQPSMGLNDPRHHLNVQMWNTWYVTQTENRQHMINWVASVARGAPGGKLKNVVFSCHGSPSFVQLGEGFDRRHAALFRAWSGLVEKIWFRACQVALIQTPGSPATGDGNLFCSDVAKAANCYVVASTETQWTPPQTLPYGKLDTFEGLVLSYGPGGDVTWSNRYGSNWESNRE